jgi:hypothetical protein
LEKCGDGSYSDVVALYRSNESTSVSAEIGKERAGLRGMG